MPPTLYDILELQRYASLDEVKVAFKRLAVRYHPDKNPGNDEYAEKFKEISNAYHILSDEESKRNYDLTLSGFFSLLKSYDSEAEKKKRRVEMIERVKRWKAEKEKQKIISDYEKMIQGTPMLLRRSLNWVVMILGVQFIFRNWFYTEETFSPLSFILATVLIIAGSASEQSLNYNILLYRNLKQGLRFNLYNRVMRNFLVLIVACFVSGILLAYALALYHFKYYSLRTLGRVELHLVIEDGLKMQYIYKYKVEGKTYTKVVPAKYTGNLHTGDKVLVQYSSQNPVIAKIIDPKPEKEE